METNGVGQINKAACVCLLMAKTECVGFPELIWR